MKRALTILLALVLMMAMAVPAMAAGQGSITIDNAVVGKTYTIYRIFDLNSHNSNYSAINYTVNAKWADFFKTGAKGLDYVNIDEMGYVTWKGSESDAPAFAEGAIAFAKANSIVNDGSTTATSSKVEFTGLELGYYLVQSDLGALCSLDTTTPSVTIREKNAQPTTEKEVEEDSDSSFGGHNDADIGQTVNFKTTINVIDGQPKNYVLHDKMSSGLTFNANSVEVKVGEKKLTADTDYTLVTSGLDDGCTFEVRFTDGTLKVNDVVVVTYSATLNANAVVGGTGNANETHLSYTNTDNTTGKTQPSETRTYTWSMDVLKYTMKGNEEVKLEGAQFKLYKEVGDAKTKTYAIAADGKITDWTNEASKATVFTSDKDGKIEIKGLDADTYYLEEIEAPAGYNKLKDPIEVKITATVDQDGNGTATVSYGENSTGTVMVLNQTGAELPSTGGVGTTVFYVVGGLLVAVAVVLLVTKKKMSVNK